jgi:transposase
MLHLTSETKIFIAVDKIDFRNQADGLVSICQRHLKQDPRSGTLFAFINRTRTMIRVLRYHEGGYWVATKRLTRGKFIYWPQKGEIIQATQAAEFTHILKGVLALEKKIR